MEKKPTKQPEKKPAAANEKLDDGLDEEENWRKIHVENRDLYIVLDDGVKEELDGMDATEKDGVDGSQKNFETSLSSEKEHKLASGCLHSDSSLRKDPPFVRFVYSNKFEPKKFSVRAFPTVSQNQLQEYALISDFFIKDHHPSLVMISDLEHLQRDIIFKKLSSRDLLSFAMTPTADHEKTANRFNPAGYRYFTGAVIPEIMVYDKGTVVRHSAYFFESHFPFTSLYRDLITTIIGDIQSHRQNLFKEIKARFSDDDYEPNDSLALGNRISVNWIARESRQGGFLDHLYNLNINEGLQLQRHGVTIKFQADIDQEVGHQVFHLLDKFPSSITPALIASIMGGMLLEQVVVLHGASRTLIFEVVMFMLSLISPLQWPFPIVPLILSYHMRQYLDSPVPLLCGIEESPEKFELLWKDFSEQSPSVLHVQLDTGAVLGSSPLNFKEAVLKFDSSSNWEHCKKLHRYLFDPEKEASREKVKVEFVDCFRSVLLKLYMAPLNLSLLEKDHSRGFLGILGNMREKSTFPHKILDQFITGQIFHRYLENLQKSIS